MGVDEDILQHVFTSGEASLSYLKKNLMDKKFFHVGPPKDIDLIKDFEEMKSNQIESAEYIICTGLFEEREEDLRFYKKLFEKNLKKKIICTKQEPVS